MTYLKQNYTLYSTLFNNYNFFYNRMKQDMKNIKKILSLLLLSILFQTKNIKAFSKETVEQIHFITSITTILTSIIPDINGNTKWHNLFNKHKNISLPSAVTATTLNQNQTMVNAF